MGENQSHEGNQWNALVNGLLKSLGWKQLGTSQIDVKGTNGSGYGIDSAFYYEDPLHAKQREGYLIDAKHYAWRNTGPAVYQTWYDELLDRLDNVPYSPDFVAKFSPLQPTRFVNGMVIIWHHDNYDHSVFRSRLKALTIPPRRYPKNIFMISNWTILRISAVLNEMRLVKAEAGVRHVDFFFPHRVDNQPSRGNVVPVEFLVSKFLFAVVTRDVTSYNVTQTIDETRMFYFGGLDHQSLQSLHQVWNTLQCTHTPAVVYCSEDLYASRSTVDDFKRTYSSYDLRQLELGQQIPEWVTREP